MCQPLYQKFGLIINLDPQRKAARPGAKADLARELKVAPARITEWLSGKKEPGGDYALRLQKWVESPTHQ